MLKNKDLFAPFSKEEKEMFGEEIADMFVPDEYPWQTLAKIIASLDSHMRPTEPNDTRCRETLWVNVPPAFEWEDSDEDEAHGTISSFGRVHIRGGKALKSDEHTTIKGPVILGEAVKLRKGAVITGPCLVGSRSIVGGSVRVKHSVLLPGARVVYGTRVSYSIVGRNAYIGSGVVSEEESFEVRERPYTKQLPQIGFFAGDDSWIGGGCIISPGVSLAMKTRVKEGAILDEEEYDGKVAARSLDRGRRTNR